MRATPSPDHEMNTPFRDSSVRFIKVIMCSFAIGQHFYSTIISSDAIEIEVDVRHVRWNLILFAY